MCMHAHICLGTCACVSCVCVEARVQCQVSSSTYFKIVLLLLLFYCCCCCMWYAYLNASTCVACSVCGRLKTTFHDNDFLSPQVAKMGLRETGLHGKCFYCKTTLLIFLTSKHWKWSHHALAKAWTCRAVTDNETARQQRAHPTYTAAQVDPKAKVPRDTRDWKWLNNTWFHLQNWKKPKLWKQRTIWLRQDRRTEREKEGSW